MTLVSSDEEYRRAVEPGAAPYAQRLEVLRALQEDGCATWVSMEPYPTPNLVEQSLDELLERVGFVDRLVFGRTNYNKSVTSYPGVREWYNEQVVRVLGFCRERGIDVHIKRGTWTETSCPEGAVA